MEEVKVLNTMDPSELNLSEDKMDIEEIDYKALTKEELISNLEMKDSAIKNYHNKIEDMEVNQKGELENMHNYYKAKISQLNNIIGYYERKFKLIKDILDIEQGGEKKHD